MGSSIAILGCGGHAKVVAEIVVRQFSNITFFDDKYSKGEMFFAGAVGGTIDSYFECMSSFDAVVVAIGDNAIRRELYDRLKEREASFPAIIHPSALISPSATIGNGSVILSGAVIGPDAVVGNGAIVNHKASIDHDCTLGDFAHASAGVSLGGATKVGGEALLGLNVSTRPAVEIGERATVGVGSAVICDIPSGEVWAGVPARFLRGYGRC